MITRKLDAEKIEELVREYLTGAFGDTLDGDGFEA